MYLVIIMVTVTKSFYNVCRVEKEVDANSVEAQVAKRRDALASESSSGPDKALPGMLHHSLLSLTFLLGLCPLCLPARPTINFSSSKSCGCSVHLHYVVDEEI